ncbi:YihY/virulence factor BrkB family protein [Gleimia sp. 6138-11-ORH1]|uniref:YihY/virulence factor BrkB family protein n=1 Tax=Gleimia sp. 6138-11-ORH1 TaxID=2973937 RepID=UPI0021670819|nr:YihY/virulence factor BrkB family protein [Gleimia sp. 6138-11-ORH1]MCS4485204.1 YihY/virulence factor BrkB family protein [Gleimia sp. 6138-11-ORH1]
MTETPDSNVKQNYAGSGSVIDTNPAWLPWEPRSADPVPLVGPSIKEALAKEGWLAKIMALYEVYAYSRLGRALTRYSMKRGYLLAGGISYVSLFSITAALTIGWTVFVAILGDNQVLRESTLNTIDKAIPGLLVVPGKSGGLLNLDTLILSSSVSLPSIIAVVLLVLSASRLMNAIKTSLWSMFGIVYLPENPVTAQVRDYVGFVLLALSVLVTAVLGVLTTELLSSVLDFLGISGKSSRFFFRLSSLLVAFAVDAVVFAIMVRKVAGIKVPRYDLIWGCVMMGVVSGVIRYLGTRAVGSANTPLLAAGATVVTIMLWVNLVARLVLMIAAWMANPPYPGVAKSVGHMHGDAVPNYVTMSAKNTLDWPRHTMTGDLDRDPRRDPEAFETVISSAVWESRRGLRLRKQIESLEIKIVKLRRDLWSLGEQRLQK